MEAEILRQDSPSHSASRPGFQVLQNTLLLQSNDYYAKLVSTSLIGKAWRFLS